MSCLGLPYSSNPIPQDLFQIDNQAEVVKHFNLLGMTKQYAWYKPLILKWIHVYLCIYEHFKYHLIFEKLKQYKRQWQHHTDFVWGCPLLKYCSTLRIRILDLKLLLISVDTCLNKAPCFETSWHPLRTSKIIWN